MKTTELLIVLQTDRSKLVILWVLISESSERKKETRSSGTRRSGLNPNRSCFKTGHACKSSSSVTQLKDSFIEDEELKLLMSPCRSSFNQVARL